MVGLKSLDFSANNSQAIQIRGVTHNRAVDCSLNMDMERDQYFRIRASSGLFDATNYYGRLFARGKDAIDLLNRMSTNDLKPLEQAKGQAELTVLTNEKGRFIDVLKVVRDTAGDVLLITSRGSEMSIIQWLDKFTIMDDARFELATDKIAQFRIEMRSEGN